MKKTSMIVFALLCIFTLVSSVSAYDSFFDKLNNTAPAEDNSFKSIKDGLIVTDKNAGTDEKTVIPSEGSAADFSPALSGNQRKEGSLAIDSIEPLIEADEQTLSMFQAFSGLRFDYASQSGETPMSSFSLSLGDQPIFSYAMQKTDPYFVSSNFLGENTYMIHEEDKFEEKLVDAVYRMVEKSGTETEMPDISEVYAIIQSMRDGSLSVSSVPTQFSFDFSGDIDPSAFQSVMMSLMMRFTEAAPSAGNDYFFTDIPQTRRLFTWPSADSLPAFPEVSSAITGTFKGDDLLIILNALTQFLSDNPELADAINQAIITSMAQTNPEMAQMEGMDIISELIASLKESVTNDLKDFTLIFKMDQDKYGAPALFTVELINRTETETSDTLIRFHMVNDRNGSAFEAAVDIVQDQQTIPLIRALIAGSSDAENASHANINFRIDDYLQSAFEYAQTTDSYTASTMTRVSDTNFSFDMNGERGNGNVFSSGIPNAYDGEDTTTQITYTHTSQGTPLLTATIVGESKTTEALPGLTASEAVAVSQMSESDYDALVSNFFTNIMMLSMIFM